MNRAASLVLLACVACGPGEDTTPPPSVPKTLPTGSVERFFCIYIEHCAGKFPVWLAPEQVTLVTVSEKQADYAFQVLAGLKARGIRAGVDAGPDKLGAKIRNARNMRTPYIGVIGESEVTGGTVALRSREDGDLPPMTVAELTERLVKEALPPRVTQKQN